MKALLGFFLLFCLSVLPLHAQQPNPTTWWSLIKFGDASNGEVQCYNASQDVASGGFLTLTTLLQTTTCGGSKSSYNAGMVTMKTFNFTYGTIEFSAKMAGGQGPWPAIWLLGFDCEPTNNSWSATAGNCNWPAPGSDEIDITEILNSAHTSVNQEIHTGLGSGGNALHNDGCTATTTDVSQNTHIYDLIWSPGKLIWEIDGKATCTIQQSYVPSTAMFLILNIAMGGAGGPITNSSLPQTMSVDYVRISSAYKAPVVAPYVFDDEFASIAQPSPPTNLQVVVH